jgi:hypothetical protein
MSGTHAASGVRNPRRVPRRVTTTSDPRAMRQQGSKTGLSTDFGLLGVAGGTGCFRVSA